MNLYTKIFVTALIPLIIIISISFIQIDHVINNQIKNFYKKELKDKSIISNKINEIIKQIYVNLNIISSVYEVKDAFRFNDNDLLTIWGKKFLDSQKMIFFVDLNAVVLSRAHDEFKFSDTLINKNFYKILKTNGVLHKIDYIDNTLCLIIGKKVLQYGKSVGFILIAQEIKSNFLENLENGTLFNLSVKKNIDINKIEKIEDILIYNSLLDKDIEATKKLREFLFFSLLSLVIFLSILLFIIIKKHLKPYIKLTEILSSFSNNKISLIQLRKDVKQIYKTNVMHEINSIAKAIQSMAIQVQKDKIKLERLSQIDQLTQVYNRRKIDSIFSLKFEEARRYNTIFSIIILDIDYFKAINDKYGHDMGDKVLVEFARILRTNIRVTDYIARFGGEEFLIVCTRTNAAECKKLCEKLRDKIRNININGLKISSSFGYVEYDSNFTSKDHMFKIADNFLYEAKNSGRDCIKG